MAITEKVLTAEDLARMPEPEDGTRYELVRGELVMMPPPNPRHGECCANAAIVLGKFVKERKLGRIAVNDAGVLLDRDPDTVRGADVAFWSSERLSKLPKHYTDIVPDLAVEVTSPSDTQPKVLAKILHWLDHGVRMVWMIDDDSQSVTVYRSRQDVRILEGSETIDGADVLPGFTCRVSELFDG